MNPKKCNSSVTDSCLNYRIILTDRMRNDYFRGSTDQKYKTNWMQGSYDADTIAKLNNKTNT